MTIVILLFLATVKKSLVANRALTEVDFLAKEPITNEKRLSVLKSGCAWMVGDPEVI